MSSVVCQGEFTYRITEATKNVPNSFDQERLEHPVSSAYLTIAPPSFLVVLGH
jgi:hypothetical protein